MYLGFYKDLKESFDDIEPRTLKKLDFILLCMLLAEGAYFVNSLKTFLLSLSVFGAIGLDLSILHKKSCHLLTSALIKMALLYSIG